MDKTGIPSVKRAESNATPKTAQPGCQNGLHLCRKKSRWLNLFVTAILSCFSAGPAIAQSLDEELNFLLNNGCQNITAIDSGSPLLSFCSNTFYFTGTSSGGNAAGTPQMAPPIILERLLYSRGEQATSADAAAAEKIKEKEKEKPMDQASSPYSRGERTASFMLTATTEVMTDASNDAMTDAVKNAAATKENEVVAKFSPKLSLLASVEGEAYDRDVTHFEDGYDSNIARFTVGIDSQLTRKFLAGVAFTYYQQDGDLHTGGDFENDSFGVLAYASFLPIEKFFIQATAGYASKGYERTRVGAFQLPEIQTTYSGRIKSDYDGDEVSGEVLLGYDLHKGAITFGPRASLDWIYNHFDGYVEKGDTGLELNFQDTSEFSLQSRLGMTGSAAISTGFGVLVPQMYANWVHEFENDQRTENFSFVDDSTNVQYEYETEPPDRNFFEVALGVSAVLPNGWQTYAQYRTMLGHDYLDSHVGALGMRIAF